MLVGELTPEQAKYMDGILNRELQTLETADYRLKSSATSSMFDKTSPKKSPLRQSNDSVRGILKDPGFTSSEMKYEMENLQEKIKSLESKLHTRYDSSARQSAQSPLRPIHYSTSSPDKVFKELDRSKDLIEGVQRRLSPSPDVVQAKRKSPEPAEPRRRSPSPKPKRTATSRGGSNQLDDLKSRLAKYRPYRKKFFGLEKEYNELLDSFTRSEEIRKKQKEMISKLKKEVVMLKDELIKPRTPTTIATPRTTKARSVKRKKSVKPNSRRTRSRK